MAGKELTNLYFLQDPDGPIKIGVSRKPALRFMDLQIGNYREMKPLRIVGPISAAYEKHLHKVFKKDHLSGEWFKPSEELLKVIEIATDWKTLHDYLFPDQKLQKNNPAKSVTG